MTVSTVIVIGRQYQHTRPIERYSPDAVEGTGGPGFDAWDALRLVTQEARALFDRSGIFDPDVWREQYAKVERTPEVERIESMERPGDG